MYDNVIDKDIFPSFVCSCVPQIDMMSQLLEVYDIRQTYPSENMSNEGGYHSPIFTKEKFFLLRDVVEDFTNDLLYQKNLGGKVAKIEYWCNINKLYNYNVMHMHGRADLIGIYYIQTATNSGDFVVMRNDGSQYSNLYENRADMLECIIEPEPGRLYVLPGHLWHYVTASNSQKDRISVSFNIYL